jgi:hypothetical protein
MKLYRLIPGALLAALVVPAAAQDITFGPAELIPDAPAKYRLSRNSRGQAAFDANGRLHLVYWTGAEATLPATPSRIYYRSWTRLDGWSERVQVEQSRDNLDRELGGRNPALLVTPAGEVVVAWGDYRHTTDGGGGIDNIEIYLDRRPVGGDFVAGDLRLTYTTATHSGDNGYAPRIARSADGRLHVLWYDFNDNPMVSDLYLASSDTAGVFNPAEGLAAWRLTNQADRGPTPSAYTLGDVVVDSADAIHIIWMEGTAGKGPIRHAVVGATRPVAETIIATEAGGFFDPPRLLATADGSVWAVYTDRTGTNPGDIAARRLAPGGGSFGAAIAITNHPATQRQADVAADSTGRLHFVWVDERDGLQRVFHRTFDPGSGLLGAETILTASSSNWARPVVAINGEDQLAVVAEEDLGTAQGRLWWVRSDPALSAGAAWLMLP